MIAIEIETEMRGDLLMVSSLEVAGVFGKDHKHVLDVIPDQRYDPNLRPSAGRNAVGRRALFA
jgi:phage regulator Rha-like protein